MSAIYITAFAACAAAAVTFVLEVLFRRHRPEKRAARAEKAMALGHAVKARKVRDCRDRARGRNALRGADFVYEVNGKTYRYCYLERAVPPAEITLYYINDPKNAFWGYSRSAGQKISRVVFFLLPLIVFVCVTELLLHVFGVV